MSWVEQKLAYIASLVKEGHQREAYRVVIDTIVPLASSGQSPQLARHFAQEAEAVLFPPEAKKGA